MRQLYVRLLMAVLILTTSFTALQAQLSGTKTIPGDYATVAAAVTDLNAQGVGAGGVIFDVAAGHTESNGAEILITATGTAGNTIVFQKSGVGANPLVTRTDAGSQTTTTFGGLGDAVIRMNGSDYIVFDGIDVTVTQTGIEFGYFTNKVSGTDGSQFVTIKNCNITMLKGTVSTVTGIYIANGTTSNTSATGVTVTANSGRNENITLTGNTIQNVHIGIHIRGGSASGFSDINVVVGGPGEGNTIQNYGGGATGTSYGVYMIYQHNANVSYNTINNTAGGGSNFTGTAYGIFHSTGANLDGTYNNNDITLSSNTGTLKGIMFGSTGTATHVCNSNTIILSMVGTSEATCIDVNAAVSSVTINNNVFGYGTFGSTSTSYLINASTTTPNVMVSGNQTTGTITKTGASGAMYGYYNAAAPTSGTETVTGNNFSNITLTGTGLFIGINANTAAGQTQVISNNVVSNITVTTGTLTGILAAGSGDRTVIVNQVSGLSGSGTVIGINSGAGGITASNFYGNRIFNLSSSSTATTAGLVTGFLVSSGSGGATLKVYNNLIGNLTAPSATGTDAVRGMSVTTVTATFSIEFTYNSIYINASSAGANFGTTGIFSTGSTTATTSNLTLRNNLVYNSSTAAGTGLVTAFRQSTATATNYNAASDRNLFYAGTPGMANLIYTNGTNSFELLADYKTFMATLGADQNSETENVVFQTTDGNNANFLKYDLTIISLAENHAANVTGITDDYIGTIRQGNPGYAGTGTAPDIGAWELEGTTLAGCAGTPAASNALVSNANPCSGEDFTLSTSVVFGFGYEFQWESSTTNGSSGFSPISGATNATLLTNTTTTTWYRVVVTCVNSGLSTTSASVQVTTPVPMAGVYTIDNTNPTGGTNYNSFIDAIADLNCRSISADVTFNVTAGQVFASSDSLNITATGNAADTIAFVKFGAGANPKIQRLGNALTTNYILRIGGGDYITFNGIDFEQTGTSATDWVEYGIFIQNATATNGAQHNTFLNGVVTLTDANVNSTGVYIDADATPTDATGNNSYNRFLGMTVENSYEGYRINGATTTYPDFGNEIDNIVGGTSAIRNLGNATITGSMYGVIATYQAEFRVNNTEISDLAPGGTSLAYGIALQTSGANSAEFANNHIFNIAGGGTVYGIMISAGDSAVIYGNRIHALSTTGNASALRGMDLTGTGLGISVFSNFIYDLSSSGTTSTTVGGIEMATGLVYNIFNNMISDLRAPASTSAAGGTKGLVISSGSSGGVVRLLYNTVVLSDIGGVASYTSAGIYNSSTTPTLDIRNNIIINNSDVTTGTRAVAFWKTSTTDNVDNASNNNLYYAGVPGPKNLIYYNGTGYQTIAAYNVLPEIAPGESVSVTENVSFLAPVFGILRPNPAVPTLVESSGQQIPPLTYDFEAQLRGPYPLAGQVNGGGFNPDLGADEGDFTYITPPVPDCPTLDGPANGTMGICSYGSISLGWTPATTGGFVTLGYDVHFGTTPTPPFVTNTSANSYTPGGLMPNTTYYWQIVPKNATGPAVGCAIYSFTTADASITSTTPDTRCGPGTLTLGVSGSGTFNWYDAPSGGTPIGTGSSFITPSISSTTTYYVSAGSGSTIGNVGPVNPLSVGTVSSSTIAISTQRKFFDVLASSATIESVDVFPTASIGSNFTIVIRNSSGVEIFNSGPLTTTVTGGNLQTVTLNATIPQGTDYQIGLGVNPGMNRNTTGAVYPYTIPGVLSITGNSFDPVYYYFVYNWVVSSGCESPRTAVVATVNDLPEITLGSNPVVCSGTTTADLTYSATVASPDQYSIDFDAAAEAQGFVDVTNAALPVSPISITVPGAAAPGTYNATLTVRNSVTNCSSTSSAITVTIEASATPSVTLSANPAGPVCAGTSVEFTANASGTGGGTVTYDFKVNSLSVQMGASNTYTTTSLANGDVVTVDISITGGSSCLTGTTATSNQITMTVSTVQTPSVTLAALPGNTICSGTNVTFTATASDVGGGTVTYDFKVNGSSVQTGASNTYATTTLANGDNVTVEISIAGGACLTATTATSNTISMAVTTSSTPTVTLSANPAGTICLGTSVTFTATAANLGGGTVSTYNFWVNGISVQTGASDTYTTSALADGDNIAVDIFVSGGTCLTATGASSNIITASVSSAITPAVTVAAVPAGAICAGTNVTFTATASNTGGGTVTYDFKVNGSSVQSGASNTYATSSLANNDQVSVDISISGGSPCLTATTATSNTITMTVNPNSTPTVSIEAIPAGPICAGTSVQFTATANNTGGGTVTYDFKVNGSSVQSGASNTYTTTTLANGDQVTVEVSIAGGTCLTSTSAVSGTITMTVNPSNTPTVSVSAIPAGPICAGTSVEFTASAGGTGGGTVSYDFKVNGSSVQSGASNTYTTTTLANGDQVTVEISVTGGTCMTATTAVSNTITMTVNPIVTPSVSIAANPAGAICSGTSVQFTATASNTGGGTVNYDFKVNGSSVQSSTSNTYTTTTLANGDQVTVEISITGGTCLTATTAVSGSITMTVTPSSTPTVTISANPAGAICAGTSVQFTATANNTGGGTVTYNFRVNGVVLQSGASNTYTTSALVNGDQVTSDILITGGTCLSTNVATSNTITMTVNANNTPTVSIAANPNGAICAGTSVQFTATANNTGGGTVTYTFRVNGSSVQAGASNTYSTTTLANGDAVTVDISISGGTCLTATTASSNTITMTVNANVTPTVSIAANPAGAICAGTSVQFTATANNTGGGTVTYTFRVNGSGVQTGASNTYTTTTLANGDQVSVDISIAGGTCLTASTASSGTITMTVTPGNTPTVTIAANPAGPICAGTSVQFTATAGNTGGGTVNYNFRVNGSSVQSSASNTYTTTTLANGDAVTVEISITGGTCLSSTTASSNTITMVVNPGLTPTLVLAANPAGAICAGTSVQFTATANNTGGGTLSYTFRVNGTAVQTGASNTYTSSTLTNGNTVSAEITITGGTCISSTTASSNVITMVVTPAVTPTLTLSANPGNNICAGTSVQFTATAANTGGGTVNYNFRVNGASVQNGASNTYTTTTLANGDNVTVVITITGGNVCLTTTTLTSSAITMTVRAVPTVGLTASPLTSLLPGQTTTLTATPSASTGGTVTTTWLYNGSAPVPPIAGNTYVANVEHLGTYQVLIQESFTSPALVCTNQSAVVTIGTTASSRLFIFPTPNDGRFTVSYYNNGGTSTQRTIAIFDQKGSMVYRRNFAITGPYTLIPVDMQHASTGIYYLVVGDQSGNKLADGKVHIR